MTLWGVIEAGGSKFVCAIGHGPNDIRAEVRFPTTTPGETIGRAIDFFKAQQAIHGPLTAIGIGSFGPLDPDPNSPTFGYITSTPKAGWTNIDFVGRVQHVLAVPIGFDTDVNGAALGEWRWGAAQGLSTFVYLTVGTGIGGGVMVNGCLLHGLIHPELGHIRVPHDRDEDPYNGCCPFHGDCFEGLASGPAISERWDQPAETLVPDHPAWELEAHYIALALANYICTLSPQRIVLGGGVMQQAHLFPMVRQQVQEQLNGYVKSPAILESIDRYIVPPVLGERAGVLGAIALAQQAVSVSG
ncbi:MAG: ROK family protein [Anaerolineales bacterium]|nr:MAG: ROK family protein [Anaerolineales bacterium]